MGDINEIPFALQSGELLSHPYPCPDRLPGIWVNWLLTNAKLQKESKFPFFSWAKHLQNIWSFQHKRGTSRCLQIHEEAGVYRLWEQQSRCFRDKWDSASLCFKHTCMCHGATKTLYAAQHCTSKRRYALIISLLSNMMTEIALLYCAKHVRKCSCIWMHVLF